MSRTSWPEGGLESDAGTPRLYDAGAVEDWVEILTGRRSSLLLCGDDAALDRQAQALLQGLRRAGGVETALVFDMDRALLLERFNRLLADMTVDQARCGPSATVRVWVFQIQAEAELDQARLMMRLGQDLPGSGVVVLLLSSIRLARELAPEGSSRRLQVRVIGDPWAGSDEPGAAAPRLESPMAPAAAAPVPPVAAPTARSGSKTRATVLTGLVLLVVSAGVVLFQRLPQLRQALAPAAPPPAAVPAASMPAVGVASAVEPPASSAAPPAAERTATGALAAAAAPGTVVPPAAGKSLPPALETVAPPREQVARTASWIDTQPESSWLVQHAVSLRAEDMLALRSGQPALADARIVAFFRGDGRVIYALVSGPFDTAADARAFEKDLPKQSAPAWVRSVARVKRELEDPANLAAPAPGLQPARR